MLLFTKRRKCYNPPSFGSVDFVDVVHRDYLPFRKNRFKNLTLQIAPWVRLLLPTVILSSIKYLGVSDVTLNVFSNTPFMNRSMSLSL
jgi:hypothetical protein